MLGDKVIKDLVGTVLDTSSVKVADKVAPVVSSVAAKVGEKKVTLTFSEEVYGTASAASFDVIVTKADGSTVTYDVSSLDLEASKANAKGELVLTLTEALVEGDVEVKVINADIKDESNNALNLTGSTLSGVVTP